VLKLVSGGVGIATGGGGAAATAGVTAESQVLAELRLNLTAVHAIHQLLAPRGNC
jgi:hypothetical protein